MKTILSSRRDRYLAIFTIFLIIVALTAAIVGCDGPTRYNLTISSTAGGSVTAAVSEKNPVSTQLQKETLFGIATGTVVNLTATPHAGYRFDRWTGQVADINDAATTVTVNTTYSITARFIQGLEISDWYHLHAIRTTNNLGGSHILMNDLGSTTPGYE